MLCCLLPLLQTFISYILLPLLILFAIFTLILKYNKRLSSLWFSWLCTNCLFKFKIYFEHIRKSLLGDLVHFKGPNDPKHSSKRGPLRILEIGVGAGGNIVFYPEGSKYICVDINPNFEKNYNETKSKTSHIHFEKFIVASAENMRGHVEDESVDVVVCTQMLCSVGNPKDVVSEVRRVLVKGGRFYFMEHVAYPRRTFGNTLQQLFKPLWEIYFDGCQVNRHTGEVIKNEGFTSLSMNNEIVALPAVLYLARPHIWGYAVK